MTITLDLTPYVQLTDEQFYDFCRNHSDLRIERSRIGEVIIRPPVGGDSGRRNCRLTYRLMAWAETHRELGEAFDSSTGFILPNGAERSPDAAWVSRARWELLTPDQRRRFPPLCPDFVVELLSPTDSLVRAQAKLQEYMDNGARLGWLLDLDRKMVEVYRPGILVEKLSAPAELTGLDVLPGLVLDLTDIL